MTSHRVPAGCAVTPSPARAGTLREPLSSSARVPVTVGWAAGRRPYKLSTAGMTLKERALWFRTRRMKHGDSDGSVPSRYLCDGAPTDRVRRDAFEEADQFYHQGVYHGMGRVAWKQ
jgi:hypothetical protein